MMMSFFEASPSSPEFSGFNSNDLDVNEAYLELVSTLDSKVRVYGLSSECVECPFAQVTSLDPRSSIVFSVTTRRATTFRFYDEKFAAASDTYKPVEDKNFLCQIDENFGHFGMYKIVVDEQHCDYQVRKEPANIYLPLLFVAFGLLLLWICSKLVKKFRQKETVTGVETKKCERIKSIDTFRGLALCAMMFIGDGAGGYWFFHHTTWEGCQVADLLYPWFLWIVGVCIPLSQKTLSSHCTFTMTTNILRRSVILFLFGLSVNTVDEGPVEISKLRILGVLQRIAVCYAVVSIISVLIWRSQVKSFSSSNYRTKLARQWLIYLCILGIHHYLTFYLSVPGCPRGYLGPGGIQNDSAFAECTGGAAGYIDRLLLGEDHMRKYYKVHVVYRTSVPFDPENILGTLTSIFQTFLGTQAGLILCARDITPLRKIRQLFVCGAVALTLGLLLHYSNAIPLNKRLWSLSFTLTTSGLAFLVFAILYYLIDYAHLWDGCPLFYPGTNSILVYMCSNIFERMFPWHWKIGKMNTHSLLLVENIWGVLLWIEVSRRLFKKRVLLNV